MTFLIDKLEFLSWLQRNQDKVVSDARTNYEANCPIAKFLKYKGYKDVIVYHDGIHVGCEIHDLEEWVLHFIKTFDKLTDGVKRVKGSRVLELMRSGQ